MNEVDWLSCSDLDQMLDWLEKDWKHTLFKLGRWLGVVRRSGYWVLDGLLR